MVPAADAPQISGVISERNEVREVVLEKVESLVYREACAAEERLLGFGQRCSEDVTVPTLYESLDDLFETRQRELFGRRQRRDVSSGAVATPRTDSVLLGAERQQRQFAHARRSMARRLLRASTVRCPR